MALLLVLGCADERAASVQDGSGGTGQQAEAGASSSASGQGGAANTAGTGGASGASGVPGGSAGGGGGGGTGGAMMSGDGGSSGAGAGGSMPEPDGGPPAGDGGTSWSTRELSPGPSYQGSGGGGCNTSYGSVGHAPVDAAGGKHPLFLYFVGTSFSDADESSQYTSPAAAAVTEAMARRGFVAFSVDYDNSLSIDLNKVSCLFGVENAQSMLAVACALPEVDCALGIATWGHSQGALIAHSASRDERVRAVWTTGYGGSDQPLAPNRLRVVNGENDTMNGQAATLNSVAGFGAGECPDDGRSECLRDDGSGWVVVRQSACELNSADHCWFDKMNCFANAITIEPAWVDADSTAAFALEANADWVAATVARP